MKASARVQLTLEVAIPDVWNDGTDIARIRREAVASARLQLETVLEGHGGHVRLVDDPKVTIVLVEDV
jgi:hypothetical protein